MGFASRNLVRSSPAFDGREIYFADYESIGVKAIAVADARVRTVAIPTGPAAGLAVLGDHVYWNEGHGSQLRFHRVPRVGGAIERLATVSRQDSGVGDAYHLQLHAGYLYWYRRDTQTLAVIERTLPGSGRIEQLVSGPPRNGAERFLVHASGIYWLMGDPALAIQRTPLAGGQATPFHTGSDEVDGLLAADDRFIYFRGPTLQAAPQGNRGQPGSSHAGAHDISRA